MELINQLDKSRQEKTELQKSVRKAEEKIRKLEKAPSSSSVPQTELEALYEQERDQNQVHACPIHAC